MTTITIGAMLLASALQTDTTFAVGSATRLGVEAAGGSISVQTWERPEVRIEAEHSSRTTISVRRRGDRIAIEPETNRGMTTIVDLVITVPASMNLDLEGTWTRIDVQGARGEVLAETVQSDVRIDGGRGRIHASSINGQIHISNAEGRVEVESTARGIQIDDSRGELFVEAVGGSVTVNRSVFSVADVTSVGGRITWNGGIEPGGSYFFGTHGGSIGVNVPTGRGARITVATIHGQVRADVAGAPSSFPQGQRTTFETGDGSAEVEIETFAGRIVVTHREVAAPGGNEERLPDDFEWDTSYSHAYPVSWKERFDTEFDRAFESTFEHAFDQAYDHAFKYSFDYGMGDSGPTGRDAFPDGRVDVLVEELVSTVVETARAGVLSGRRRR